MKPAPCLAPPPGATPQASQARPAPHLHELRLAGLLPHLVQQRLHLGLAVQEVGVAGGGAMPRSLGRSSQLVGIAVSCNEERGGGGGERSV